MRWIGLWTLMIASCLAVAAPAQVLDDTYRLLVGSDTLETTAANDLKQSMLDRFNIRLPGPILAASSGVGDAAPCIIIGTIKDNPLIAAENARNPFILPDAESYHARYRDHRLYIAGATAKGAMNGVYRFEDRRSTQLVGYDVHESPFFRIRVGGHKMNQAPPPGWTEIDQARYYARHYINVVWGEKKGPPMSLEARRKYGLGLMVEQRFPPGDDAWRKDPANASAIYRLSEKSDRKVTSPFDPVGRQAYKKGFEDLLAANPDIKVLYGVFGDYNAVPDEKSVRISDNAPYGHTREESIKEIMAIMKEACAGRDIMQVAWMWHAFFGRDNREPAFMKELASLGYGSLYNEAGNKDCWIIRRDNYDAATLLAENGKSVYGPNFLPLISCGGACESINPLIGVPLPNVAEIRLARLADIRVRNFCTWWAGYEGWTYQPNNEVVSEMIWNPRAFDSSSQTPFDLKTGDSLLCRIAQRDFGRDLAPEILEFWRLFDKAVVSTSPLYQKIETLPAPDTDGLHIYDWYQRMGIFTEAVFGGPYPLPLTPADVAARKEVKDPRGKSWMKSPHAHANYAAVLANLSAAIQKIEQIRQRPLPPDVARRVGDMHRWSDLYRRLLTTQHNFMRAVSILAANPQESPDSQTIRNGFTPVVLDEIANDEALIRLINTHDVTGGFAPNFNIRSSMEDVIQDRGSIEEETAVLRHKTAAMRLWLNPRPNVARARPATASSQESDQKTPAMAVDGDALSRWSSQYSDNQWFCVDLEHSQPIQIIQIRWNPAYARSYEIQVSTSDAEPRKWTTIYQTDKGHGSVETIELPEPVSARYVRMLGHQRATGWGYSFTEFELYPPK